MSDTDRADLWRPDILGTDYQQRTLDLGADPDGEGEIFATLVRHLPDTRPEATADAVLYVHGFTDYFFQKHLAEHLTARGHRFYALDLRKCGRSLRSGQSPHFISDLALYDAELNESLRLIRAETGSSVLVMAHSTGGLITSLWLDRLNRTGGTVAAGISGVVLNSPWFDLQGPPYLRSAGVTRLIDVVGRVRGRAPIALAKTTSYGDSLHHTASGEWEYNLDWKPLPGFPVRFGWLRAIRRGHAQLHRGLNIGVPALLLRSRATKFAPSYCPEVDTADAVLDVRQIQRWAGCLGDRTNIVPIDGARHDVFLSAAEPRAAAFAELDSWLDWLTEYRRSRT
ncbi:alpha/beta hydrolase [Nocardia paucivorans]|uniref:alpha/beta hydrolase n=1 Tax=Nocardia paucivorans TaxID=114259 RepID=UPI0005950558|nr:alpha/beta hydrolase [Nocardia paucivorans]